MAQTLLILAQTLVLGWTAFLIRRYTKATENYTKATEALLSETARQNKISLRPIVLPEFTLDTGGNLAFRLRNCGEGCAVNVTIDPLHLGPQVVGGINLGAIETRLPPVDYLPSGEARDLTPVNYTNGQQLPTGGNYTIFDWWFHTAKAPAIDKHLRISFEDVEGRQYQITAHIYSPGFQPRKLSIGRVQEIDG